MALIRPGMASTIDTLGETDVTAVFGQLTSVIPSTCTCGTLNSVQCSIFITWEQFTMDTVVVLVHLVCFECGRPLYLSIYLSIYLSTFKEMKAFSYRVTVVKRVTKLLQTVQVLDIVFGLVGCISNPGVQLPPWLDRTNHLSIQCKTESH